MPTNHLTTEQIIQGCRRKDASAQEALVQQYSEKLYTICLRYCGDEANAKDVLQESLIRVFKSFKSFDPEKGSLQAWMGKVTVNMALKSLNKKRDNSTQLSLEIVEKASTEPSAFEQLKAQDLLKIIQTLPVMYRQVFNLSVIEGYNHREIGQLLNIEEASSRSNLSRAKNMLRKKLTAFKKNESWVKIS